MKDWKADGDTLGQLNQLGYVSDGQGERSFRPLLICDVDEVVLHLVAPFAQIMEERGFELRRHAFQLTGNVFDRSTGAEATQDQVRAVLWQLFEEQTLRQHLVEGAVEALNDLARDIDILFLTNMPHDFRHVRINHLFENGLDHPLITNTGSKMPAIDIVKAHRGAPIGFIDDTPKNLEHVRAGAPDIHLFHFMADETFRDLAGDIDGVEISTSDWTEAHRCIRKVLVENRA
ncbi:MAG: hypothetical protein OXR62_17090 [Ahrensia sp.]|nr:hypothetical protein [Ahrensia sp.]